jgi:hypothetical protein
VTDLDAFSIQLLEEAKRFLEKANETDAPDPYLHAALMLGFSSLESHLNGLVEELTLRQDTTLLDEAVLTERGLQLKGGRWELSADTRFFRLEDRMAFIFARYAGAEVSTYAWWSDLKQAVSDRNSLVHPRDAVALSCSALERYLKAIVEALNDLYLAVFRKGHPAYGRGIQSAISF